MMEQNMVIGRPGEDFHEHPSCSYSQIENSAPLSKDVTAVDEGSSSLPKLTAEAVFPPTSSHSDTVASVPQSKDGVAVDKDSSSLPKVIDGTVLDVSSEVSELTDVTAVDEGPSSLPKLTAEAVFPPTSSHSDTVASVPQSKDGVAVDKDSSSLPKVIDGTVLDVSSEVSELTEIEPTSAQSLQQKKSTRKRNTGSVMKKLSSKGRKFVNDMISITKSCMGDTGGERLSQAKSYGGNEQLFKNFDLLNKQAQTFLLMQLKLCRKNKMSRTFTMEEKRMALLLMKQSPKAYKLLETMFALPTKRTLHRLSEKVIIKPGINRQLFSHIRNTVKNWGQQQKLCSIVFDEIALTPYLTYNESNDLIHGFVDVAGERKMKFCDHALVFMIRGICSSWRQCISYYFCEGTTSTNEMQEILKQIVAEVAQTGLIPLGLVCDQGSTFRTAIKKFREETIRYRNDEANTEDDGIVHIAGHHLSVFYDPPHLLKGLRNNFLNKNIIWEGKRASWKDIQYIYDIDSRLGHTRALPKLTAHHVDPDKIKKMKVSVAAQVFSSRTAAMLNYTAALNKLHNPDSSDTVPWKRQQSSLNFLTRCLTASTAPLEAQLKETEESSLSK
ncbi:uncharacterized protein LOC125228064 [Leguminivora glycinivorella]|uniref:uncharacterized protein LOC125228064 n=1 Tax=Leguminivora glycinivorella TaxID=1035111 RepID=UPI00200BF648|nr:uncharacterized protein LOC125228064 [Leguminivora glycinivorella]